MAPRLLSCFRGRGGSSETRAVAALRNDDQRRPGPVVVELFSSQGCSASSEAEAVFSRIGRGDFREQFGSTEIILLAYHVDYWDYTGWKDPFATAQWTVRQKAYVETLALDTMFTPLLVVQGRAHCIANDSDAILASISAAPRPPSLALQATFQRVSRDTLQVAVTGTLKSRVEHVMVGLYECGLVTECTCGANKDKVLANDYVVRRLDKAAAPKKGVSGSVSFGLWEGFNPGKCGVVVFVEDSSHHILGAQNFQLPQNHL